MPLSITLTTLREDVGRLLGYGTDESAFTSAQDANVMRCINAGLEDFYMRPDGHVWSFLNFTETLPTWGNVTGDIASGAANSLRASSNATTTFHASMIGEVIVADTSANEYTILSVACGTSVVISGNPQAAGDVGDSFTLSKSASGNYTLASGFAGISGPVTFAASEAQHAVSITSEPLIRQFRQRNNVSGPPGFAATRPLGTFNQTDQQRFELLLYPTPDQVYNLSYRVRVNPLAPASSTREHFHGGMQHAGTISEACLAAAERLFFDESGLHNAEYQRRLAQSIALDRRMIRPEHMDTIRGVAGLPDYGLTHATITIETG